MKSARTKGIPNISIAVQRLIRDASRRIPEFSGIDSSRVLVVLGEARRASRATVRPMHVAETGTRYYPSGQMRPRVRFNGRNIYYVLTLRPLFFLTGTPVSRISTILHEIFHFSEEFDGTLHPGRRHAAMGRDFDRQLAPIIEKYMAGVPEKILKSMALNGPVKIRMWIEKPGLTVNRIRDDGVQSSRSRRMYTEKHTLLVEFPMKTGKRD